MKISNRLVPLLLILALSACNRDKTDYSEKKETMYQVATLQSLMAGNYDGFTGIEELEKQLNGIVNENGMNLIYALRLDVNAESVTFRSELPQEKPYCPLAEALPDKQRSFTFENMGGTVVAVYFPSFFAGQNTPGWHFHFISGDRQKGGHMLELSSSETAVAQLDATPYFNMYLPQDSTFSRRDLSEDMSGAIEAVERSAQ